MAESDQLHIDLRGSDPRRMAGPVSEPQHYLPVPGRELRAQTVQRLQVGLFGLCSMLLLVGLANIIMDRALLTEPEAAIDEVTAVDDPPKKAVVDPLADIGVVPAADPTPEAEDPESPEAILAE